MTGKPHFGDTSERIQVGAVQTERREHDIELPSVLVDELWDTYNRAIDTLCTGAEHVLCGDSRVKRAR